MFHRFCEVYGVEGKNQKSSATLGLVGKSLKKMGLSEEVQLVATLFFFTQSQRRCFGYQTQELKSSSS
ncbi:hypothetical protein L1987_39824 [Smallanthus sonchifolius]|uniref:Uncharacterized protein n=1 Tax=Smallanthus sonchifolius TaxID=185202 RepID=A0ACB9GRV2_9ASTR|nr:hypothetical protein L1987_39824 [Smallanthus sonchifolius]